MTYYCVWSEQDTILCLTTDQAIALDVYSDHLHSMGRYTDDDWIDSPANIEEFDTFPTDRRDIFDYITDVEQYNWETGETVII